MKQFTDQLQEHFNKMCATGKLFRSSISGDKLWDLYLESFEQDPVFRDPNSSVHKCNHCNNFMRRYGNIVAIVDNKVVSMFDFESSDPEYANTTVMLGEALRNAPIKEIFFETLAELKSLPYESCSKHSTVFQLGVKSNPKRYTTDEANKYTNGRVKPDQIVLFEHLFLMLPAAYVDMGNKSIDSIMAEYRDAKNVFQKAMEIISVDTFELVKDLINQGSLLDGQTHLYKIEQMIPLKKQYDKLSVSERDNWCWTTSYKLPFAKFKNELMGVLCTELAEGVELNKAVQAWNKRVDPVNYMKTTAPITKKQIAEAEAFVTENGYTESFNRRFATIDDINVSEILHSNVGDTTLKTASIFSGVKSTSTRHKRSEFDGIQEVPIEKFMKDILPGCTSVEAFLKNNHDGNMVSLTTAVDKNSKPIFKWSNNYSYTFNGNLAGKSQIKEAVKSQGGKVDGVLRFSIMWSDGNSDDSDLDAHCVEPTGEEIYFSNKVSRTTGGNLDIDITQPLYHRNNNKDVVENITYPSLQRMRDGRYTMFVRQFSNRNSKGFTAEIEFNGELYSYTYNKPVKGDIKVAYLILKNGEFTIEHLLPLNDGLGTSKEVYGLETNNFHKVNLICLTPNHWGDNNVGNKHYLFMLDGCKSPTAIRSFHNENLLPELAEHRKVLEVLATTCMVESTDKQLSGLGFNATVKDELIVRLSGSFKRVIKIIF